MLSKEIEVKKSFFVGRIIDYARLKDFLLPSAVMFLFKKAA